MNHTVDRLNHAARTRFAADNSGGIVLSSIILLSGVLSALFFWGSSRAVFADVWPPLALALGLAVGLLPSEGAFFAWRRVRATKADMTAAQLRASAVGLWGAVVTSVFSTFALFVVSFPAVPDDIAQYGDWFVFVALSVPLLAQVVIIAAYSVNERATLENYERARLGAVGFAAYIDAERARTMAIVEGMSAALESQLTAYGGEHGAAEAERLLRDGRRGLLDIGRDGSPSSRAVADQEHRPAVHTNGTSARPTR